MVRFFKVNVLAFVIVISYLSLEIADGFPFVAVNVAVPVLFVLISVLTDGGSKKLFPVVPSKLNDGVNVLKTALGEISNIGERIIKKLTDPNPIYWKEPMKNRPCYLYPYKKLYDMQNLIIN